MFLQKLKFSALPYKDNAETAIEEALANSAKAIRFFIYENLFVLRAESCV